MNRRFEQLVLLVALVSRGLLAQAPATLSYQGFLTENGGAPVSDGNQVLTFRLYTVASGGDAFWTETHLSVPTSGGVFAVLLGSITSMANVNFRQPLFLGITRGADPEMSPRAALAGSAGAMAPWGRGLTPADISFMGGKVGIGTSNPLDMLDVAGSIRTLGAVNGANIGANGGDVYAGYPAGSGVPSVAGYNTAIGIWAFGTRGGTFNAAVGYGSLMLNGASGHYNTAAGAYSLYNTAASQYNTAVGYSAGRNHNNGWNNVFVGANTDVNQAGLYNVIAVGQGTTVTAASTARFGNGATVSYGGWAGWSNVSDGRFKKNVREDVPGLAFVTRLRPVSYNFDVTTMDAFLHRNDAASVAVEGRPEPDPAAEAMRRRAFDEKERITYTGFVAQEVEAAAREVGFDFSGVDGPKNENDYYSLRYAEFVVPLVKAVQEQQEMIEGQRRLAEDLQRQIEELALEVRELRSRLGQR